MDKCIASENGVCRNVMGFGTPCNGYSDKCYLKPHYDTLQKIEGNARDSIKKAFGIKGDNVL